MAEKYEENCIYIKDSVLEPFYIKVKINSYEIYKVSNLQKNDEFCGCFSDFQTTLKKIAKGLMHRSKQETLSLRDFIKRYELIIDTLIKNIPEVKL